MNNQNFSTKIRFSYGVKNDKWSLCMTQPSPGVYDFDKKALKSGRVVAEPPESYTEGPFIIFDGRKSIFGRKFANVSITKLKIVDSLQTTCTYIKPKHFLSLLHLAWH